MYYDYRKEFIESFNKLDKKKEIIRLYIEQLIEGYKKW